MRHPNQRGSAMLITLIALGVLLILVVGAISFSGSNRAAAAATSRGETVSACAQTARKYMLSQLKMASFEPQMVEFTEKIPDGPTAAEQSTIDTNHYGGTAGNPVKIIAVSSEYFGGSQDDVRDVANVITRRGSGSAFWKAVVRCEDPQGRESEVEFVFRRSL